MSKVVELIARMRGLPDKEKRATQLSDMIAVRDKLAIAADEADRLRGLSASLHAIGDVDFVEKVNLGLTQTATTANGLRKRYENGAGFERKRSDDALTLINERLENASATVSKGWRALIDDQARRYRPLADAATKAGLPGEAGLAQAIGRLEAWRESPPSSQPAAETYKADAARLPAAIASLGLEGRAGKFMIDASNGRARAKDLQDPSVLAFLNDHPAVWAMLKVGL